MTNGGERYAIRRYRTESLDFEQEARLPEGWEPVAGEVVAGGRVELILVRRLADRQHKKDAPDRGPRG